MHAQDLSSHGFLAYIHALGPTEYLHQQLATSQLAALTQLLFATLVSHQTLLCKNVKAVCSQNDGHGSLQNLDTLQLSEVIQFPWSSLVMIALQPTSIAPTDNKPLSLLILPPSDKGRGNFPYHLRALVFLYNNAPESTSKRHYQPSPRLQATEHQAPDSLYSRGRA